MIQLPSISIKLTISEAPERHTKAVPSSSPARLRSFAMFAGIVPAVPQSTNRNAQAAVVVAR